MSFLKVTNLKIIKLLYKIMITNIAWDNSLYESRL